MNDLPKRTKSSQHASIDKTSRKPHPPELVVCTWESCEGNLADESAVAHEQQAQFAELPAVPAEDFESLFFWFIS